MNGAHINLLMNANSITKNKVLNAKHNGQTIYKIKKLYKDVETVKELNLVNQQIEVRLAGTKYFKSDKSVEYLVDIEKFIEVMKQNKLKHLQTLPFADLCSKFPYECQSMNTVEKQFSFLNTCMVFVKE